MKIVPIYSLTISLDFWSPKIWRRIWIKGDEKLDYVAWVLFTSMGWTGYHLSEFIIKDQFYGNISIEDPPEEWLDWTKYSLYDIARTKLTQFKFLYDFGDSWEMTVKIRELKDLDKNAPYPVCVNGKNAAPPEDVGSYVGFEHFIKVMKDENHPEYKEISETWISDTFDPSYFSVDEVNDIIQDKKVFQEYVDEKFGF